MRSHSKLASNFLSNEQLICKSKDFSEQLQRACSAESFESPLFYFSSRDKPRVSHNAGVKVAGITSCDHLDTDSLLQAFVNGLLGVVTGRIEER